MLQLRLRLPVSPADAPCALCDGTADRFGDHARACPCGGDRTKRHNRLRAVVACWAKAGGLHPEVEKPGLLPPRLDLGGASEDGVARGGGRRPADVYLPLWDLKGPAAFDLAVTSGMRPGTLAAMAQAGDKAVVDYEVRKREHLNTDQLCRNEGLQFLPLVAEACGGGWGPIAERTWRAFGSAVAAKTGEPAAAETARLLQALSLTLQRENARAILRRQAVDEQNSHVLAEP